MPPDSLDRTPAQGNATRLMISAGEASGDAHAAHALQAFSALPDNESRTVQAFGMGGAELQEAGCELVVDNRDLSVIGFVDVLINYPKFLARLAELRRALTARRPDLLLIVDYPDFNLKLADTARALGIPVLMYVAPQVWAWRAGRIPDIVRRVSHLAVLFPFEQTLWREAGAQATCVGHPMVSVLPLTLTRAAARQRLGLSEATPLIALLPGSRPGEIRRLLPLLIGVAARLLAERPGLRFALPRAASIDAASLDIALRDALHGGDIDHTAGAATKAAIQVLAPEEDGMPIAVKAADLAIVASGTATLETGLLGTPMIVVYRVAALNALLMRRLVKIRDIALVNIVAERRVVPEYVQEAATVDALARHATGLLDDDDARAAMATELAVIRERLGGGDPSQRVAHLMAGLIGQVRPGSAD